MFKGFHLPVNAISNNTAVMICSWRTVINRIPVNMTLNFTFKRDKMALKPDIYLNSLFSVVQQSAIRVLFIKNIAVLMLNLYVRICLFITLSLVRHFKPNKAKKAFLRYKFCVFSLPCETLSPLKKQFCNFHSL